MELADIVQVEEQKVPPSNGGAVPTYPLHLKTPECHILNSNHANAMLDKWHYLGSVKGIVFAVGHHEGCCVFTNCRSRIYEKNHPGVIELSRMVGMPDHRWTMTSLMAQAVRECRRRGYKEIITYADPWNKNTGTVYKAAGWEFVGETTKDTVYILDGKRISRRALYDRHGTQSKQHMKNIYGNRLRFEDAPPKKIFRKWLSCKPQ